MAKRWLFGTLIGVMMLGTLPQLVRAQSGSDPVPVGPSSSALSGPMCPSGNCGGHGWQYRMPTFPYMPILHPNPMGGPPPCPSYEDDDACFVIISAQYVPFWRHRMKDHVLAVVDPIPFDDPNPAPVGSPVAATFRDVRSEFQHGYGLSVGFFNQDHVWEFAGFYVQPEEATFQVTRPGQLSSFFFNPPVGFEGTGASLWDNADVMRMHFKNQLVNAEINSRWFDGGDGTEVEFLIGVRFLLQAEKLALFTSDDSEQIAVIPETEATYTVKTNNRLLGGQIGAGISQWVTHHLAIGINTKLGLFANYADIDLSLVRGDGLVGIDGGQNKWGISALNDTGAFVSLNGSCWRVLVGYRALWIWGLATAQDQIDFNLGNNRGRGDVNGSVLYHGPMAMIDFVF
ncbi:MAG: hypothetical protein NZM31_04140 [Gemmatales bacterium]|nr:hypothetical protein [Gemmatales bacterium]MDW8386190.1 hypothetical protein [Gemmatales bacterium]